MVKIGNAKFVIVNGWSDMNRGDSAILLGMIWLIRKHLPDCFICVMSEFGEADARFASSYWAIRLHHPEVQILPALFPYPKGERKIQKAINAMLTFVISCAVLAVPAMGHYLFRGAKGKTWRKLIECDALLSKGGHVFYFSQCSLQAMYGFFKHAFPLLLGARLRKKTALYAQSVGPFRGRLCQLLAKWFFNRLDVLSVRERISLRSLENLGVTRPIHLIADAAFILSRDGRGKELAFDQRPVIITPRQWGFDNRNTFENYMKAMAFIVTWLSAEGYKIWLVSHTIGPTPEEDDRIAVQYLYRMIEAKENVQAFDTEGLTAYDLIRLYASARLLIGTRFHSVIFALLSGTPVIAISYFGPKTFGIMKSLGLERFVFDINNLNVESMKSKIQDIFENHVLFREAILLMIEKLREEAESKGLALLNAILGERW